MRLFTTIFTIFFFCSANANEIKSIVQVDSYSITNVDLIKEIRINQILRKRSLSDAEKKVLLKNLIEEKIKEIEVAKNNINVNKSAVDKRVTQILGNYKLDDLDQDKIKKYMFKKVEINMRWNKLITILFSKKLEVNMNEIEENIKNKNIDIGKKEEIIQIEKTKKINIISNTFYNEVKRKYLIKILDEFSLHILLTDHESINEDIIILSYKYLLTVCINKIYFIGSKKIFIKIYNKFNKKKI